MFIFITERHVKRNKQNIAIMFRRRHCQEKKSNKQITSCAGGRQNMPRPLQVTLRPFDLECGVLSHVWRGLPLCQF